MAFLLRVILPDRPGSLGALATAIGTVGADIVSVDIVDKFEDMVVDDIVVEPAPGQMPDTVMSAAYGVPGVSVETIRPFDGALTVHRELDLLDALSTHPAESGPLLVEEIPRIFRSGWAVIVDPDGNVVFRSHAAPELSQITPWRHCAAAKILDPLRDPVPPEWTTLDTSLMGAPAGPGYCIVAGRPGGPDFRPSELSRFAHLVGISRSIWVRFEGEDGS